MLIDEKNLERIEISEESRRAMFRFKMKFYLTDKVNHVLVEPRYLNGLTKFGIEYKLIEKN